MTSNPDELVEYGGKKIKRSWLEQINSAQKVTEVTINGQPYDRVRFGDESEDWGANEGPCRDCGVLRGQFHVPDCDIERCPICDGQLLSCDCQNQDE